MQVWCFESATGLWALCKDESGACLPEYLGPWTLLKPATLDGIDEDERQAEALIREHGYCCFDAKQQT